MNILPFELIFLLIPAAAAIWAAVRKLSIKKYLEASIIALITILLLGDGIAAIAQLHEDVMNVPRWIDYMQLYMGVFLLPLAYMYFAIQVGTGWKNRAIYECLVVSLIVLVPNITVFIGEPSLGEDFTIKMNRLHIVKNGALVYIADLSDIAVMLQAIIIAYRIWVFSRKLRKFELTFSKNLKVFFLLALLTILFAISTYIINWEFWKAHEYLFLGGFAFFTAAEFIQVAKDRDISALVTKENAEPVMFNDYVKINNDLANRARYILDVEKRYLSAGLVIDDMVSELGTNRTYFTRMMRIEFGQSFNEYVNNQRLKYAQDLLKTTDKGITEIAEESGFGSASAFCRVFKRLTETTPEAWREVNKKKHA